MIWRRDTPNVVKGQARRNATSLRRRPTDAEKVMWQALRGDFAGTGTHFRHQVAIGNYIADFCCHAHRLIVEVDGPIHEGADAMKRDRIRTRYFEEQGYRVLRFRNDEIVLSRARVLDRIAAVLATATPTPGPSPQGGGVSAQVCP